MRSAQRTDHRAFVRRHTRLQDVPGLPGVRLHLADDVMAVMQLAGRELRDPDPPLPFWGFAWAGGLAVCRYLRDHPDEVAGRTVLDLATGSGLCAIVAAQEGATTIDGVDIDPFSEAAFELNAKANDLRMGFVGRDILDDPPPPVDVVLAGDVSYEETMARRMLAWLTEAARRGSRVLIGDPGRRYLATGLHRLATYTVVTSHELEPTETRESAVYTID